MRKHCAFFIAVCVVCIVQGDSVAEPPESERQPEFGVVATFSICAVDPETGVCGAAVASKYPAVANVVAHVRPGVGAFCTQHWDNRRFATKALDLLGEGKPPEEVLTEILRGDKDREQRQMAIIDLSGRAANRNP